MGSDTNLFFGSMFKTITINNKTVISATQINTLQGNFKQWSGDNYNGLLGGGYNSLPLLIYCLRMSSNYVENRKGTFCVGYNIAYTKMFSCYSKESTLGPVA